MAGSFPGSHFAAVWLSLARKTIKVALKSNLSIPGIEISLVSTYSQVNVLRIALHIACMHKTALGQPILSEDC